ncbi:MAG: hypothetical protein QOI94_2674 [Acidobacteriaceae bacterium]|nr:hypothetical protein [Acidobacteriaceae bacterium]
MTDSFSDATDPPNIIVPGSVQNGPFGPSTYSLGNGLMAVNTYDILARLNGGWPCAGSSQPTCTGGTLQAYGYTLLPQPSRSQPRQNRNATQISFIRKPCSLATRLPSRS